MVGDRDPTAAREAAPRRPSFVATRDGHGQHRDPERGSQPEGPEVKSTQPAIDAAPALREDHHDAVFIHQAATGLTHRPRIASVQIDGERAQQADRATQQRHVEEPPPSHVIDPAPDRDGDQHRISEGLMVWRYDERASERDVLGAAQVEAEVQTGRASDERTERVEHGRAHGPSLQKNGTDRTWGAPTWPPSPQRSERPGEAGALLYSHGGPDMAPIPPTFGAPRRSRGAPLSTACLRQKNGAGS